MELYRVAKSVQGQGLTRTRTGVAGTFEVRWIKIQSANLYTIRPVDDNPTAINVKYIPNVTTVTSPAKLFFFPSLLDLSYRVSTRMCQGDMARSTSGICLSQ